MEPEGLIREFREKRDTYKTFTSSVESLLRNLVSTTGIEPFAYESRTKTISSFEEKIQREEKLGKYCKLDDVTDLAGVRIICFLQEDCDHICKLIEDEFDIDWDNSTAKQDELDPDKFGYLSTHYVISLNSKRRNLKEFKAVGGLKSEVQVRTLLQHTWAAIDWKFRYKEERESPKTLRRRLFRISALLEAADNEFSDVKIELDKLRSEYSGKITSGNLDVSLNTESVLSYIANSEIVKDIISVAKDQGLRISIADDMSVAANRLISTLNVMGVRDLRGLDNLVKSMKPDMVDFFKFLVRRQKARRPNFNPQLFAIAAIRFAIVGSAPIEVAREIAEKYPSRNGYDETIIEYIEGVRK